MNKHLKNLVFDVVDRPELAEAIIQRLKVLGFRFKNIAGEKGVLSISTNSGANICYFSSNSRRIQINAHGKTLRNLVYLYDLSITHTIQFDGGDPIEISHESFEAMRRGLK